ncbi:CBS domain-containing protein [Alginatibacterium sediminis]|uniref:CBS domain-containing protein n=1 Tax=Alginatibacterium sediminis TaxID=2164068 RepID=A0A420E898_9ALTE|nr:CBS domain-containing protein [Alginatibacterium sediminis]RKF15577.1 CBS domain-containing protein [Alginatibacterium sediminis]
MLVSSIMTQRLVSVEMDDKLDVVKEIFDNTRFHHLLVLEDKKLVGLVSDRDLLKSISPYLGTAAETSRDTASLNKKVHQVMNRALVTLSPDSSVFEAIKVFNKYHVTCLPIVDNNNEPLGIITWKDILKAIEDKPNELTI